MRKTEILLIVIIFTLFSCNKSEKLYITNVNIVDVESGSIITDQHIEIENGIITRIDNMNKMPEINENIFDGNSRYVTPGLSDMNVYLGGKMSDTEFWGIHPGDRFMASGITTIRNGSFLFYPETIVENEAKYRGGVTAGPNIIKCVVVGYNSGKNIEILEKEFEKAEADYIKTHAYISEDQMNNIMSYAEENGIYTNGTVYSYDDFIRNSKLGFDEVATISVITKLLMESEYAKDINWFDEKDYWNDLDKYFSKYYDLTKEELLLEFRSKILSIINVMEEENIVIGTSLSSDEISDMKISTPEKYEEYAISNKVPEWRDNMRIMKRRVYGDHFRLEAIPEYVKFQYRIDKIILELMNRDKILIVPGTEFSSRSWYGLAPGIALHDELRLMMECGFTNLEALQSATLNASKIGERMGLDYKWGIIKEGYNADIVFTNENPLEDINILRRPNVVMKSGIIYTDEILQNLR